MPPSTTASQIGEISAGELKRFAEFFYRQTGINFPEHKLPLVERRVATVLAQMGYSSFREGFVRLRTATRGPEMQKVINALTVNETYFYRELHQLDLLVESVLPEIAGNRSRANTLRIWSVPCSTGEEPYSIAIHVLEKWAGVDSFDVEIHGSDIDTNVLKAAGDAIYSGRAVSRLPTDTLKKYFRPATVGNQFVLTRDIADAVAFSKVNLLDPVEAGKMRDMDVVFCRNLLIYLDDAARRIAIGHIYECLKPGGYVLLGHAESMSRISSLFEAIRHGTQVLYRKPLAGGARS